MKTTYTYDHYYVYDELTEILSKYASEHPELCRLTSIGDTSEGRKIWALEVTDLSTGDFSEKPGFALDGNVHAGEVTGSMACMYFLDTIFSNLEDPEIQNLLKNYTVYCVPRITPDGSECYLTTPTMLRSVNKMFPFDELQPGVQPEDMDGDGVIRQMRVKNPHGVFKKYEKDPRIMVKREPDDVCGEFYDVFSEGYVLKYNEMENVKPAPEKFGNDFNRNLGAGWSIGGRGGQYAFSNPETYALANFLYEHKNLCTCLNFHTHAGIYLFPPALKGRKEVASADMTRYKEIGEIIQETTGYPFANLHDEFLSGRSVGGSIDDFCHYVLGFIGFTCECWDIEARLGFPYKFPQKPKTDEEMLKYYENQFAWIKENGVEDTWKDWTVFQHPELGEVEIGGFDMKHLVQNPPAKFLPEEVEKHTKFMLREIKLLPHLEISTKVTPVGENYKVDVTVSNTAYLPTYVTDEGKAIKSAKPVKVTVCGELLDGKAEQEIGHLNGFALQSDMGRGLGGVTKNHEPSSKTLHYLVKGDTFTITAGCPRSGVRTVTIDLKAGE